MLARYMLSSCVCPSVCPRVTSQGSTKTIKPKIKMSYNSPGTPVSDDKDRWEIPTGYPQRGTK